MIVNSNTSASAACGIFEAANASILRFIDSDLKSVLNSKSEVFRVLKATARSIPTNVKIHSKVVPISNLYVVGDFNCGSFFVGGYKN